MGREVSDEFTVPLCRGHYRKVHRCGDEAAWWQKAGLNPTIAARALWLETYSLSTNAGECSSFPKMPSTLLSPCEKSAPPLTVHNPAALPRTFVHEAFPALLSPCQ
jgi:hypothetical protein